jgi:ribulose-5-phosphate 4-epimerase/fuculose-1-phosphate aldolase
MATVLERPEAEIRPAGISPEEWQVRVDLAAFYRIAAIHDYDDFLYTHITARVPGPDHHFLINPFGLTFDEITASSLVKVDLDGNVIGESEYGINYAGYVIHSAIHAVREDALWIAHFHTRDGMGASAHAEGLLPLSQRALYIIPRLGYHDYEGVALNLDERERLQADLGADNNSCCCATMARWRWAARRARHGRRSIWKKPAARRWPLWPAGATMRCWRPISRSRRPSARSPRPSAARAAQGRRMANSPGRPCCARCSGPCPVLTPEEECTNDQQTPTSSGFHSAWRRPRLGRLAPPGCAGGCLHQPGLLQRQAQVAERGKFDYLFVADSVSINARSARIISTASSR